MEKGQGFEFLGYRFEAGRRWVRPKSRKAVRDKIRQKTGRTRSGNLESIITELNPILKGWFGGLVTSDRPIVQRFATLTDSFGGG